MLQKIHIKGYRALENLEIELHAERPLVLIGENASGKSTILDAVALICEVAAGRIGDAIYERGGWAANAWAGTAGEIELEVLFSASSPIFEKENAPVEYWVRLGNQRSIPTVLDEELNIYKNGLGNSPLKVLKGGAQPWLANAQSLGKDRAAVAAPDGNHEFSFGRGTRYHAVSNLSARERSSSVDRVLPVVQTGHLSRRK